MDQARVQSVGALGDLRTALVSFSEGVTGALAEAEADLAKTISWIRHDRLPYWRKERLRRNDEVVQARSLLSRKKLAATTPNLSHVDERMALRRAQERVAEAEAKIHACERCLRELERESEQFSGKVSRLSGLAQSDLVRAASALERMRGALESYAALGTGAEPGGITPERLGSMARAGAGGVARGATIDPAHAAMIASAPDAVERSALWAARTGATVRPHEDAPGERPATRTAATNPGSVLPLDPRLANQVQATFSPPRAGDLVLLAPGAASSLTAFVWRIEPAGDGDSGWFLGSRPPDAVGWRERGLVWMPAGELVKRRSELSPMLGLPSGWLGVLEDDRVSAVVGPIGPGGGA